MTDVAYEQRATQENLATVTEAARAELDRAIQLAGLQHDPLRHTFIALGVHLDAMHRLVEGHITAARRPISDEDLRKLSQSASHGAWRMTAEMMRAHNWRTIAITVLTGVVAISVAGFGGYFYGRQSGITEVQQAINAIPNAAARYGAAGAQHWLALMNNNDIDAAWARCRQNVQNGRKACEFALWIEPPKQTAPTN
jgi:hypothetical protein